MSPLSAINQAREAVCDTASKVGMVVEFASIIENLKSTLSYNKSDPNDVMGNLVARAEDFLSFIVLVQGASSWQQLLCATNLYLKTMSPKSVTLELLNFIDGLAPKFECQSGFNFSDVIDKWAVVRDSPIARHFANLFDVVLTFGIVPEQCPNIFRLSQYKSFQGNVWNLQSHAVSFVDMVLKTLKFFVERGYHAFVTGDWSILLYEEDDMRSMDREYSLLTSGLVMLDSGRLDDLALGEGETAIHNIDEYDVRAVALEKAVQALYDREKSQSVRSVLASKLSQVKKIRHAIVLARKQAPIRVKPFSISLFGGSSVAKSSVALLTAKVLPGACGFPNGKDSYVTLNDMDAFQSEYKSHHTTVIFDDHGNSRPEYYKASPVDRIIKFSNNVPMAALNPEADKKGNIMITPKFMIITTNVKNLLAETFSNHPASILRRMEYHVEVRLRPEYVDPVTGGPDSAKMNEDPIPDAWLINIERCVLQRLGNKTAYEFRKISENLTIYEYLDFMVREAKLHHDFQKKYVATQDDLFAASVCPHGYLSLDTNRTCPSCALVTSPIPTLPVCDDQVFHDQAGEACDDDDQWEDMPDDTSFVDIVCIKIKDIYNQHAGLVVVATMLTVALAFSRIFPNKVESQHVEIAKTDIALPDELPKIWKKVDPIKVDCSNASKTTDADDLVELVARSIGHLTVRYERDGQMVERKCDALPIRGNIWMIPSHMISGITPKEFLVKCVPDGVLGKCFKSDYDPLAIQHISGTDCSLIRFAQGGDNKDLSKFFPNGKIDGFSRIMSTVVHKDADGVVSRDVAKYHMFTEDKIPGVDAIYPGYHYTQERDMFKGYCMATHVAHTRYAFIMCVHLAGRASGGSLNYGIAGLITKPQLDAHIDMLASRVFVCHSSEGDIFKPPPSTEYSVLPSVTSNSCQYMDINSEDTYNMLVFGDCSRGKVKFNTSVRESVISPLVAEVMDLPKLHGPPNKKCIWRQWSNQLQKVAVSRSGFDRIIMAKAHDDYLCHVIGVLDANEWACHIKPLHHDVVLAGCDGVRGLDRLDLNTSMGFPWNKPKKHYLTPSERIVEGVSCPLDIDPEVMQYIDECEQNLREGRRIFSIHRASLKDEAVLSTKEKIRVIIGCPFPIIYLVRKYFLSVVRFYQRYWLDLESAVGINAYGSEWDQLARYMNREDSICWDGDYSSFDTNQSADDTIAVWELFLAIVKHCGYSDSDLQVCRGLVTEIVYPLMEFDGTFIQLFGGLTSGQPMTTIANCVQNSFYSRYAYYKLAQEMSLDVPPYYDVVRSMFYGDDNIHNVPVQYAWFNRVQVARVLCAAGVKLTAADKSGNMCEYTRFEDLSFLKRLFRYDYELNRYMAPLELASISKQLHCYMHSNKCILTPEQRAADSLINVMREFEQHGRVVYEERLPQVKEVALRAGIDRFCTFQEFGEAYVAVDCGGEFENQSDESTLESLPTMYEQDVREVHSHFTGSLLAMMREFEDENGVVCMWFTVNGRSSLSWVCLVHSNFLTGTLSYIYPHVNVPPNNPVLCFRNQPIGFGYVRPNTIYVTYHVADGLATIDNATGRDVYEMVPVYRARFSAPTMSECLLLAIGVFTSLSWYRDVYATYYIGDFENQSNEEPSVLSRLNFDEMGGLIYYFILQVKVFMGFPEYMTPREWVRLAALLFMTFAVSDAYQHLSVYNMMNNHVGRYALRSYILVLFVARHHRSVRIAFSSPNRFLFYALLFTFSWRELAVQLGLMVWALLIMC